MHGASRLGLSAIFSKVISGYTLLEERYLMWAEDEVRVVLQALYCLPKTTPCRPVFRVALDPQSNVHAAPYLKYVLSWG